MIGLDVKSAKAGFFDRKAVVDSVDRARLKVLSKFGAFVRRRAKSSIRKRKGVSPPAGPPSSHTGLLKKFLFFSYDPSSRSVVIGPARIGGTVDPDALPALEYGGESTVVDRRGGKRRKVTIRPRPFMGPALDAERPGFPGMWADSVR